MDVMRVRLGLAVGSVAVLFAAGVSAAQDGVTGMYQSYRSEMPSGNDGAFDMGPEPDLARLVKGLTRAIDKLARYHVNKAPPLVYRVPHYEMEEYVCSLKCDIKAWYLPGQGIFLDESLHPETDLFDRSILLHEMVHYFQDRASEYGSMDPCNRWFHRELDAYQVQNRYLSAVNSPSHVGYTGTVCDEEARVRRDAPQVFDGTRQEAPR